MKWACGMEQIQPHLFSEVFIEKPKKKYPRRIASDTWWREFWHRHVYLGIYENHGQQTPGLAWYVTYS